MPRLPPCRHPRPAPGAPGTPRDAAVSAPGRLRFFVKASIIASGSTSHQNQSAGRPARCVCGTAVPASTRTAGSRCATYPRCANARSPHSSPASMRVPTCRAGVTLCAARLHHTCAPRVYRRRVYRRRLPRRTRSTARPRVCPRLHPRRLRCSGAARASYPTPPGAHRPRPYITAGAHRRACDARTSDTTRRRVRVSGTGRAHRRARRGTPASARCVPRRRRMRDSPRRSRPDGVRGCGACFHNPAMRRERGGGGG